MNSFKLNTYLIGGPENIQSKHILPNENKKEALLRFVSTFASLGLDVFQLRCKSMNDQEFLKLANKVANILITTNCKFCINDNVMIVKKLTKYVDILHLGQDDMKPEKAKKIINDRIKIGLSITNLSQINNIPSFVSYIGVGPIFPTVSKSDASEAMGELILEQIINKIDIPIVAIGGIKLQNIKKLRALGVSGVAMISEIFNSDDPEKKFKEFKSLAK